MDSLFVAGNVPKDVQHSLRLQRYFNQLDKIIECAQLSVLASASCLWRETTSIQVPLHAQLLTRCVCRAGIAAQKEGEYQRAFVMFLKYMNLGQVVKQHNAYAQKMYERDRRKLERQMRAVLEQMEYLKPQLLQRWRQSAPEPLPPALATALVSEAPQPEPESSQPSASTGGPRLVKIFGDGHCLYRSVASGLNPQLASLARNDFGVILDRGSRDLEEAAAQSLRLQVANYMERSWESFPTIIAEERCVRLEGVRGSAWGGEEEILALSQINGVQITVHSERDGRYSVHTYGAADAQPAGAAKSAGIHLRYTRNEQRAALTGDPEAGGHYELLLM